MRDCVKCGVLAVAMTAWPSAVQAQDASDAPPSLASALGIPGISPRIDLTGFVEAQTGSNDDDDPQITVRADLYTDFSSDGMGLWEGTLLRTHLEWREGDSDAVGRRGVLLPTHSAAFLPLSGEGPELTSLYVVQKLGDKTNLIIGKVNAVDLLDIDPFFGGMGNKRFKNIVFVAPPSGVVPPVFMGYRLDTRCAT